ncbi:MAG: hypothetical protein Q9M22_03655, partial [Mariprofundaceae bacterium]|nr:hypothetical protein [Mariprofundaceae bacterium]
SRYMKDFNEAQLAAVERFSKALSKRFMHPTLRTLKTLPDDIEGDLLMGATRKLFDLEIKAAPSIDDKIHDNKIQRQQR